MELAGPSLLQFTGVHLKEIVLLMGNFWRSQVMTSLSGVLCYFALLLLTNTIAQLSNASAAYMSLRVSVVISSLFRG